MLLDSNLRAPPRETTWRRHLEKFIPNEPDRKRARNLLLSVMQAPGPAPTLGFQKRPRMIAGITRFGPTQHVSGCELDGGTVSARPPRSPVSPFETGDPTLSLRENKALVPDLGTTFVVGHSPACAVLLTPRRCLLWIRGDRLWYAATTGTGHNGRRIDRHVPQVVVAYHKLSWRTTSCHGWCRCGGAVGG